MKTEDEALEHIVALVQMYREQGRYLERIYKWAKRVGIAEIRRQIIDDAERRKAYFDRFVFSPEIRPGRSVVGARRPARTSTSSARWPIADRWRRRSERMIRSWIAIGALADIPRRGARCVKHGETTIAVFRTVDDRVFALEDRCPHRSGPLSQGIVHDGCVTCPLHNWVISLETGQAQGADEGRTTSFPVRLEEREIYLNLDRNSAALPAPT